MVQMAVHLLVWATLLPASAKAISRIWTCSREAVSPLLNALRNFPNKFFLECSQSGAPEKQGTRLEECFYSSAFICCTDCSMFQMPQPSLCLPRTCIVKSPL